jgi:hypothetical protein
VRRQSGSGDGAFWNLRLIISETAAIRNKLSILPINPDLPTAEIVACTPG